MASAEHDTASTATTRLPGVEPPDGRRIWLLVVVAVTTALVLGVVGLLVLRDDSGRVGSEVVKPVATTATVAPTSTTAPTATTAGTGTTVTGGGGGPVATQPTAPATTRPSRVAYEEARLSLDGLGPVDIGMTLAEASTAAGVQIRPIPESDLGRGCLHARADSGPDDRRFMVVDGRIARIEVSGRSTSGPRTRTVSGIGVGSTEDEVKRAYPGRISVEGHPYVPSGHYLVYTPTDPALKHLGMVFETDGRVVTTFRAGLAGPVRWIEGCA